MEKLLDLINEKEWILIYKNYNPDKILEELSFKDSMHLASQLYTNKDFDDALFIFAVDLLQETRKKYPKDWKNDWRNDLFLGDACNFTMRFHESYEAYKRASLNFNSNLPPNLLVSLAGCYLAPGKPSISIEEAERMIKLALEKEKSIEAVTLIRGICKTKHREEEFSFWDKMLEELEKKNAYMKKEWPEYLKNS